MSFPTWEILRATPARPGFRLRGAYLSRKAAGWGPGSSIGMGCRVLRPHQLHVGAGVSIARDVTLDCRGHVTLEDGALIGFESVILTSTHNADRVGVRVQDQGFWAAPVVIGARAWLGMRVLVMPGVTIGEDAIVGSGSLVTADVAPRTVVGGVPARVLRER